uniref:Protein LHCP TRANSLOCATION DEFECT n=1 Tax=Ananas comosus var. bracteatus TaxID=296719 RepID=A0A6V7NLU8_ANACO|nr:unnamed protein product [Ananas comosus var. bracteatus]
MASIPCSIQLLIPPTSSSSSSTNSSSSSSNKLGSPFLAARRRLGWFGGTGWPRSQSRDDFDRDDVEQYFNYMGMLAVEGSYDKMEALLNQNIHPVDILLMLAASEGDKPKIEELLRAGAKYDVKDADGRTALDRVANDEIKELILGFSVRKV